MVVDQTGESSVGEGKGGGQTLWKKVYVHARRMFEVPIISEEMIANLRLRGHVFWQTSREVPSPLPTRYRREKASRFVVREVHLFVSSPP